MATPKASRSDISIDDSVTLFTWLLTTADHTGEAVKTVELSASSIQVLGTAVAATFGGSTVVIEGSLDGTNFVGLDDVTGTVIEMTTETLQTFLEGFVWVRPRLSVVGTAATITAIVMARKPIVSRSN